MMNRAIRRAVVTALVAIVAPSAAVLAGPIPLGETGSFSLTRVQQLKDGAGGEFTVYDVKTLAGTPSTTVTNASYSDSPATLNVLSSYGDPLGTPILGSFQTFCLEMSEDALLVDSNFFVVGSAAAAGGKGVVSGRDPLSKGSAWLYSQFAQGLLNVTPVTGNAAGNYFAAGAPTRSTEAGNLQRAIWWLEHEGLPALETKELNPYYMAAWNFFGGELNAMADADEGEYGVYVLNNFKTKNALDTFLATNDIFAVNRTDRAQDFLYYQKDVSVPDGGMTAMLLGGALVTLGALRRKRSR